MPVTGITNRELLFLSALLGVDNIWGIEDPFRGADGEINREDLTALRNALVRNGCLRPMSDGAVRVGGDCAELIDACQKSNRVYLLDTSQYEREGAKLRFFVNGDAVVSFQYRRTASLARVRKEIMEAEIAEFFAGQVDRTLYETYSTDVVRLKRMGGLTGRHFLQELKTGGCGEQLAALIVEGLQNNSGFRSMLVCDRYGTREALVGKLIVLECNGNSLMVHAAEDMSTVQFAVASQDGLSRVLRELLGERAEADVV